MREGEEGWNQAAVGGDARMMVSKREGGEVCVWGTRPKA